MKYLVMECHLSYAVVLDENGGFRTVANRNYEVGQTVTDIVEMEAPQKKTTIFWGKRFGAIAACLVLVLGMLFVMNGSPYSPIDLSIPYASVYMTINPEVRIDVNRWDMVVGLAGINEDGVTLLQDYEYRQKKLDLVMQELVDRAIDLGFLHEGGTITLTLDGDSGWVVDHSTQLDSQIQDHLTDRISVTIDIEIPHGTGNTVPGTTVPVGPETDYGDSAYEAGTTPYDDTDYGPNSDGVTDYDTPYESTDPGDSGLTDYDEPTEADTDYGPGNDGVTDYDTPYEEPDTDYGPESDGVTDYDGETDYSDTDYDAA